MRKTALQVLQILALTVVAAQSWSQAALGHHIKPIPHYPGWAQSYGSHHSANARTPSSPWTPLTNQPDFLVDGAANPILLTDGTVLVQDAGYPDWWRLTPDQHGSYVNGTWTQVASLPAGYSPLYHSSAVLPDGRLIIEGGEYNFLVPTWTPLGAIYDPLADTWTSVDPPPFFKYLPPAPKTQTIGDAQSVVLADGTYMQADCCTKQSALLDPKTLTWKRAGAGKADVNDEEGWTLLPNDKVLTVDAYVFAYDPNGTNSEIYDPYKGTWSSAGSTIVQLWDSADACGGAANATQEVGPAILRPDGTVFYAGSDTCPGAAGHTAIYDSRSGRWRAGPDMPGAYNVADGPAALEPNGKVLLMASPEYGNPPATFLEWDGKVLQPIPGPPNAGIDGAFYGNMLVLPTGQILLTDFSNDIEIFTPAANGDRAAEEQPFIVFTPTEINAGRSYEIFGFGFNGVSQGAAYGDDAQAATNYPLVRITNLRTKHVFYSRTHDHSSMAVASDDLVWTHFDVPAGQERGASKLEVVANGIASPAVLVDVR